MQSACDHIYNQNLVIRGPSGGVKAVTTVRQESLNKEFICKTVCSSLILKKELIAVSNERAMGVL